MLRELGDLFAAAGLASTRFSRWGEACGEKRPGVYVVVADGAVVYVGRTRTSLAKRLGQFYRHEHGMKAPHRGQDVLLLTGEKAVCWSATEEPMDAEARMLRAFERNFGRLPLANRRRGEKDSSGFIGSRRTMKKNETGR
jgi:hypothetical protein